MHPKEPSRLSLAQLPTPVQWIKRLPKSRGLPPIMVKRDDLTGLALSGNKVRKLEYLIAQAIEQGCDTLVTHGGYQSNHCRASAAAGAQLGLHTRIFLREDDPARPRTGNLFLDELFGAELSFHKPDEYNGDRAGLIQRVMDEQQKVGRKPYFFPVGGSVPLGTWGYIRCMDELRTQLDPAMPFDIVCAVGSCGTHAGLVIGKALFGLSNWRVVGIPIAGTTDTMRDDTAKLVRETIDAYGLALNESQTPIEVLDGFIGPGYAKPYPEAIDAIRDTAKHEGLLLDPSYTGKAMHGLLTASADQRLRPEATKIFIHTGGAFGLMAQTEIV